MGKIAFVGFGEVNTPIELLTGKCKNAQRSLEALGLPIAGVWPVTDDPDGRDVDGALKRLEETVCDAIILCIAGWIPSHAVIRVAERYRDIPMVLWGLCGWTEEDGRLVTTADQAGTSALRGVMERLGYTFCYFYDIVGLPSRAEEVARYCRAAQAAASLRSAVVGMAGYRDMNLYGTLCDAVALKKALGIEIECFELLEAVQRRERLTEEAVLPAVRRIEGWRCLKPLPPSAVRRAAEWYASISQIAAARGYRAVSLKDVDGMKKLLGFPPAPVFMLLDQLDGVCVIPENDCLGAVTQLMVKSVTGQCAAYLEFYEFFADGVLAGVPDFVPEEMTDGAVTVMPAAFGELSEGILNVSLLKTGTVTLCRLGEHQGVHTLHMTCGEAVTPRRWEEAGWTQPAPQLPGLHIRLQDPGSFADRVLCQHYIVSYGDNRKALRCLCGILGIGVLET